MTDYTKNTNFTAKDSLLTGDPNKTILGADFDAEFDEIATASATKANKAVPGTSGDFATLSASGDLQDSGKTPPTGEVVGTSDTQTLTNKTLTSPVFASLTTITFEGATEDAFETALTVVDPTADRTVTIPDATGTVVLHDATQTLTNKTIGGVVDTNLVDKSASETITGNWTFSGTLDFGDVVTNTVMLTTPEPLTLTSTGTWPGVAPTATTGNSDIVAAIIAINGLATVNDAVGGSTTYIGRYARLQVRAGASDGAYTAIQAYALNYLFNDPDYDYYCGFQNVIVVKLDSNGDFDYQWDTSEDTISLTSLNATLIGYIQKV